MDTQSPNTFSVKTRTSRNQGISRYRPDPPPKDTDQKLSSYLQMVLRQVFDLIYQLQDLFTPAGLFVSGDSTLPAVVVPVEAAPEDLGTSLGLQLSLTRSGRWLVSCSVCLQVDGDTDLFTVSLSAGQSPLGNFALWQSGDGVYQVHQQWLVNSLTGDESLVLRIKKAAGAGTSSVQAVNTTFSAVWEGA